MKTRLTKAKINQWAKTTAEQTGSNSFPVSPTTKKYKKMWVERSK